MHNRDTLQIDLSVVRTRLQANASHQSDIEGSPTISPLPPNPYWETLPWFPRHAKDVTVPLPLRGR